MSQSNTPAMCAWFVISQRNVMSGPAMDELYELDRVPPPTADFPQWSLLVLQLKNLPAAQKAFPP